MKKLLPILALLALAGFGCTSQAPAITGSGNTQSYTNTQYGFGLMYPATDAVYVRADTIRDTKYLGQDMDFFASLSNVQPGGTQTTPTEIVFMYAAKGMTVNQFTQALLASDKKVTIKSADPVTVDGVALTKVISTTDSGLDKTDYLLDDHGTLIIFSVFLQQESAFDSVLQSIKTQ